MGLRFTREALIHIEGIHFYVATRNKRAASRIVARIFDDADRLREFPRLGHQGIVPGTLELTVSGLPYVVYEVRDNREIIIFAVFHGSQNR